MSDEGFNALLARLHDGLDEVTADVQEMNRRLDAILQATSWRGWLLFWRGTKP